MNTSGVLSSWMFKIPQAQRPHPEGPFYCIVLTDRIANASTLVFCDKTADTVVLISMSIGHGELLKPLPKMRITDNL
jgi:hypothetical protein